MIRRAALKLMGVVLAEEVFPVCSPALLAGPHPLRTASDLRHHTLLHDATIRFDAGYPNWRGWLQAAGADGVPHERGLRINASAAVTQAAVAGQGVALGRSMIVADDLAANTPVRAGRMPGGLGLPPRVHS